MATATNTSNTLSPLHESSANYSPRQSHNMFTSLKNKLNRNSTGSKGRDGGTVPEHNSHPQSRVVPTTRRPPQIATASFHNDGDEAPPAYSPAPNAEPAPRMSNSHQLATADDPYSFLSTFDTIFLIDDSGSMAGSLWREAGSALEAITPICTAHDSDGIDLHFLNHPLSSHHQHVTSPVAVRSIFASVRPGGGTPTGQRLDSILRPYLRSYASAPEGAKPKPINIICITDGAPSDDVESPLIHAAKTLDKLDAPAWQVGVQFFQVGSDEAAMKHLESLDDDLAEIADDVELRDLVDTVPFRSEGGALTGDKILKIVLGAVNRRLDRRANR